MRNECNIVKDLLPLYIDGSVSEDSRKLVEEHTAICEDCGNARREMMLALPENRETPAEKDVLQKAAKKLRRKHMRRGMLLTIAGLLVGILIISGISAIREHLRVSSLTYEPYLPFTAIEENAEPPKDTDRYALLCGYAEPGPADNGTIVHLDQEIQDSTFLTTGALSLGKGSGVVYIQWSNDLFFAFNAEEQTFQQIAAIYHALPDGTEELLYRYGSDGEYMAPAAALTEPFGQKSYIID